MVRVPLRLPEVEGVKTTLIEHDWPTGIVEHWLVWAKSPEVVAPETVMAFVPVFETRTV